MRYYRVDGILFCIFEKLKAITVLTGLNESRPATPEEIEILDAYLMLGELAK
jgi:hypothetical protein